MKMRTNYLLIPHGWQSREQIRIPCVVDWTIVGIYRSPKVPVRELCQTIAETLNCIKPNNSIIILGDFNIHWLVETERRPLFNLLVRDKHYKRLISACTTDQLKTKQLLITYKQTSIPTQIYKQVF